MYQVVRLFEDEGTLALQKELLEGIATLKVVPSKTEEDIMFHAKEADFIICGYEPLSERVLANLPKLKMINFQSIGFNSVDLAAANKLNIPVSHIGNYCTIEVADYVTAAILMTNRKIIPFNQAVKNGQWDYYAFPEMRRLAQQTVGFLGFGNIPKLVAERLIAFGCRLVAFDPYVEADVMAGYQVEKVDLTTVFKVADYISCHLPLNDKTSEMIDASLFNLIEQEAVFINTSRGGVINETDLAKAIASKRISAVVLDVLNTEYPNLEQEVLVPLEEVVVTPHASFYSLDSVEQSGVDTVQNILNYINKKYADIDLVNRQFVSFDSE